MLYSMITTDSNSQLSMFKMITDDSSQLLISNITTDNNNHLSMFKIINAKFMKNRNFHDYF